MSIPKAVSGLISILLLLPAVFLAVSTGGPRPAAAGGGLENVGWVSIYSVTWYHVLDDIPWSHYSKMVWQNYVVTGNTDPALRVQEDYDESQVGDFVSACHANGVQAIACLASNYWSPAIFPDVADIMASSSLRGQLVDNLALKVSTWGLDGIAIDWSRSFTTQDIANYGLFLQELRTELGASRIITPVGPWTQVNLPVSSASDIDFISLMAYDYFGAKLPAYGTVSTVNTTLGEWIGAGFAPAKLYLGLPFFARYEDGLWVPSNRGWYSYVYDTYSPTPDQNSVWDPVISKYIEWNGPDLAAEKVLLAQQTGCGGVWGYELGFDKLGVPDSLEQAVWDAINSWQIISFTVTDHNSDGISFGETGPGSYGTPADYSGGTGAATVTIGQETNVDVLVQIKGTDFSGPGTIPVGNVLYDDDDTIPGSAVLTSDFITWYSVPVPLASDHVTQVYFWLGVPAGTPAGAYSSTITFQAVPEP